MSGLRCRILREQTLRLTRKFAGLVVPNARACGFLPIVAAILSD